MKTLSKQLIVSKREKLLLKIRQNPKNVSFQDLKTLLEQYGFAHKRTKGSHNSFKGYIGNEAIYLVVLLKHPLKVAYVKAALELIDRIIASQESDEK